MNYIEEETVLSLTNKFAQFAKELSDDYGVSEEQFYTTIANILSVKIASGNSIDDAVLLCGRFCQMTVARTIESINEKEKKAKTKKGNG
jgi:hypothetical protein